MITNTNITILEGDFDDGYGEVLFSIFTDSALWAGSVIESPCPSVCVCVCTIGCSFFGEVFFTP